jgi:glycosyltransferase involved in cell wall biosynthesis
MRRGSGNGRRPSGPNRVLLTVSGTIPDDLAEKVAAGARPRADYLELAGRLDADLLDRRMVDVSGSRMVKVFSRVAGPDVAMAWMCFRRRRSYDVILTDGEQVGLPLALLSTFAARRNRAKHVMIVHIMSVRKKSLMFRGLHLGRGIDAMIVYSSAQQQFATDQLGVPAEHVHLHPFMVDTVFFDPAAVSSKRSRAMICTAGLECRDYPTLLEAASGLDVDVVVAAASPWSKRTSGLEGQTLPPNVTVVRLDLFQLRQLYGEAAAVVMPLQPVDFQAGITTILEAMAMGRVVICTRTAGQTDTLVEGQTGWYVPERDGPAMRAAIEGVLSDPAAAAAVGSRARAWAVQQADIGVYVDGLAAIVGRYRSPQSEAGRR